MRAGVTVIDPATTWLSAEARLEPDVTLLPGRAARRPHPVAAGAVVGPDCTLATPRSASDARVRVTTADQAVIGAKCDVGPYTYLRPGTRLATGAKAGAYVEMKDATIGAGAKVPHLTYVGDAEVGAGGNIGCGVRLRQLRRGDQVPYRRGRRRFRRQRFVARGTGDHR